MYIKISSNKYYIMVQIMAVESGEDETKIKLLDRFQSLLNLENLLVIFKQSHQF